MQDDQTGSSAPLQDNSTPASHEHINRDGMHNGVPEAADEGQSTGMPHDERRQGETAGQTGGQDDDRGDKTSKP